MTNTENLDCVVEVTREKLNGRTLAFVKGLSAANFHDPRQPRGYNWTLENVIQPLMESGYLGDGVKTGFDDRKLRYGGVEVLEEYGLVIVKLGITHFNAYKADEQRSKELNAALQSEGETRFEDKYAFFARPLGVTVLPVTTEGSVFIGVRTNKEYGNYLHGARVI